jgi:nucleoside-diphosphate-sugar epimerase
MSKQTILGAGGIIAEELAKSLTEYTKEIRLVSRNPKKVNDTDELMKADLTKAEEVDKAVEGSSIVYVTIGFPYSYKTWKASWPPFISNVIKSCKKHKSRLVFFDNIYMYDANHLDGMDEQTPINPPSKKGTVRAEIAKMITDEFGKNEVDALIARCADYYGPRVKRNGIVREMMFSKLAAGKKGQWFCSFNYKHSVTFTPDAGKATALLGNTKDAYNQVWHLPTASNPPTGKEWVDMIANEMGVKAGYQAVTKFLVTTLGLFVPIMRELKEMLYQYDRDYVFDSSKFEKKFNFKPTSYQDGIKEVVKSDYST